MDLFTLMTFVLGASCVGGVVLAALYPRLVPSPLNRRIERIAGVAARPAETANASRRKRTVEATVEEVEELQSVKAKKRYKPSLLMRLRQANLAWSKNTYYLICLAAGATTFLACLLGLRIGLPWAAGGAIVGGLAFPHLYIGFKRRRRLKRFRAEFANAIDVIVRGIKSGLPVGDCLRIVAAETQEPVKGEFKTLIEDQTLGLTLAEAVQRLPDRMPLAEASFFAIAITVQSTSGGNLAEALGNLSKVLRERKKMEGKIAAMSAEAKASGGIIGSLPIIVACVLYLTSPAYIEILFTTLTGNIVLAVCAVWMMLGIITMRQMINFDF